MFNARYEFGPIIRALMRNKVGAVLIACQIAVTMSIVVNAIAIISQRSDAMATQSGVDEANSFYLTSSGFAPDFNKSVTIETDLRQLRQLPGVLDAVMLNEAPISGFGTFAGLKADKDQELFYVGVYMVDEHGLNALDVELIAGENFTTTDVNWNQGLQSEWPNKIIITQAMALKAFPDQQWQYALGKNLFMDDKMLTVTGIIDQLQGAWVNWRSVEHTILTPQIRLAGPTYYYIRTEPGLRDPVMLQVEEMLSSNTQRIILDMKTMTQTRQKSYRRDHAMVQILITVMSILTLVTAFGIVGLANFNVSRRTKQIGTKRALGASRGDIVRHFMLENFIISVVGVSLGLVLSIALNMLLVEYFSLAKLPTYLLPLGMVTLCLVGQLAVLGPARKAAAISPAVATRTV